MCWVMCCSLGEVIGIVIVIYCDFEVGEDVEVKVGDEELVCCLC